MNKSITVAKWEFIEKVKSKAFIISLFLTPALIIGFSVLPTLLASKESENTKVIGILDLTQQYFSELKNEIEVNKIKNEIPAYAIMNNYKTGTSQDSLIRITDEMLMQNKLDGYILIRQSNDERINAEYRSKGIGNFQDVARFEKALNNIRIKRKLTTENIDPEIIKFINEKVEIKQVKVDKPGKGGKEGFLTVFFSSLIFILLLMMMIIYSGQMLVRSLLEEKSNRLIEILISSCTPKELLFGKVIGLSTLGLSQIFVWLLIGLSLVGTAIVPMTSFENIHLIMLYFILGFIFYTTLFVGIGSIANTEQEAQQITSYVSLILVLPSIFIISTLENPDSVLVQTLSYIPFTLPSVMILRVNASSVPFWEILITTLIMIISVIVVISISAKIFRFGILYYGKMPSMKEIRSWLKE